MSKSRIIFSCLLVLIAIIGFSGGAAIARTINNRNDKDKKEEVLGQQSDEPIDTLDLTVTDNVNQQQIKENSSDETESSQNLDGETMAEYNTSIPGVRYRVLTEGSGKEVQVGTNVLMHYEGTFTESGEKFDSSYDRGQPFQTTIGVGTLIQGWDQAVPGMKEGEKRELLIDSDLAYGPQGNRGIPPNSDLTFIVEVIEVLD